MEYTTAHIHIVVTGAGNFGKFAFKFMKCDYCQMCRKTQGSFDDNMGQILCHVFLKICTVT